MLAAYVRRPAKEIGIETAPHHAHTHSNTRGWKVPVCHNLGFLHGARFAAIPDQDAITTVEDEGIALHRDDTKA
jgi:hypothetical protein